MNRADLTHTFTSKAKHQSNVTYSIPLPSNASVHAFKALIDGHMVEGVVKEKGEARAAYRQAVSMNQKAALLQQRNIESQHH
jgi:Ca-activated chloride channel family protein